MRAIDLNPDYHDPYNNLGNLLRDQFMIDAAIQAYKQALAVKPDFAEACFNLSLALEQKGHRIEAIFYLQQTVRMQPEHLKAHRRLAQLLPADKRDGEAKEHAREAQWLAPRQKLFYRDTQVWRPPSFEGLFS